MQGLPKFFGYPLLSQEWEKLQIKFSQYIQRSIRIKAHEKFRKKGTSAYPGTAQFFRVPPIISGTGKATEFNFCMHIYGLNRNKSPLKIRERWPWALSGSPENFPGAHT